MLFNGTQFLKKGALGRNFCFNHLVVSANIFTRSGVRFDFNCHWMATFQLLCFTTEQEVPPYWRPPVLKADQNEITWH